MKYIFSQFFFLLLVTLLLLPNGLKVSALSTGFDTESLSSTEFSSIKLNITTTSEKAENKLINCFDVNENGFLAVGFKGIINKTVDIYSIDGGFQRGYSFECYGDYGIELDSSNNLIIHFVRPNISVLIDENGEVLELAQIKDTIENNEYWNYHIFSNIKKINNRTYAVKNKFSILLSSGYGQLILTDSDNKKRIIIDETRYQITKAIIVFALITILLIFTLTIIIRAIKNRENQGLEKQLIYPLSHLMR